MLRYPNGSGNSGVEKYEIGSDYIDIKFKEHKKIYRYYSMMIGEENFKEMCRLATIGKGLNSFINKNILVKNSDL